MNKPLTSFDAAQQWCDYELLSTVAHLLRTEYEARRNNGLVKIPDFNTRSIMIVTQSGDYVSLNDLAKLLLHIADHLENADNYKEKQ